MLPGMEPGKSHGHGALCSDDQVEMAAIHYCHILGVLQNPGWDLPGHMFTVGLRE